MISKIAVKSALALAVMPFVAWAEMDVPAQVLSHYRMHLRDEPTGVYEWDEEDLLFVQVQVQEATGDEADEMQGRIDLAEHDLLFAWLSRQASEQRKDPVLPRGMTKVRNFVRSQDPLWEYAVDWNYSFCGPHLSRHEVGKRVCCAVYKRSEVLKTMPKAFLRPVGTDEWIRGCCTFVQEKFCGKTDRLFMWQVGLLDVLTLALDEGVSLDAWVKDFGLEGEETYGEFKRVETGLQDYMKTAARAKWMQSEKNRIETLPDKVTFVKGEQAIDTDKELKSVVVTNQVGENEFEIAVTRTEVHKATYALHRRIEKMAREARFERLFLSGGRLSNAPADRTTMSVRAEESFYADGMSMLEREKLIVEALRENPGDKILWNLLARVMMGQDDYLGGIVCLRNALRLDREYEFALTNLSLAYGHLGFVNLSHAAAIVARGIARDKWCLTESTKVLSE